MGKVVKTLMAIFNIGLNRPVKRDLEFQELRDKTFTLYREAEALREKQSIIEVQFREGIMRE